MISRAMEKGMHLCENMAQEGQTWEKFEACKRGKHLFIFGVGGGMDYFLWCCCNHMKISGVIDNDKNKQGNMLGECCGEAWRTEYEKLIVQNPNVLKKYDAQEVVVLITSINFYYPMVEQLKKIGIDNCYVLLMMEADKRRVLTDDAEKDFDTVHEEYVEWCCHQRIESDKIVMSIGVYGDHARRITRALLNIRTDLDIVWVVNDLSLEKPDGVRTVFMGNWKKYMYEMETAKIWLYDDLVPGYIRKRMGQVYIQVKHWSSVTLKCFYLDDKISCRVLKGAEDVIRSDGARMDYLFSGSEFDEATCRSGFGFKGKAVRVGSARSDILFDKAAREKVLTEFELGKDVRICLYAPTYRYDEYERNHSMSIQLDMEALLDVLNARWDGAWYLFVRLHPSLLTREEALPKNDRIINAGGYRDGEELAAAADVMVTDYSSIMFEGAYKHIPVFLYAPDKREYIDGERTLLIDYDTLPFPLTESNEELHKNILEFDGEAYAKDVERFLEKYGVHEDGHASERAARFVMEILEKG